jgi:glycosyltransferase involved in cell wall biosynthesis
MGEILRADIERLGLTGKAWLTPYSRDMPMAMNAIDCLVHSQVGTEAFGLVLLEAFACGRPVIASALDGIPEAFACGRFGQLVPPEDVEALAATMLRSATVSRPSNAFRADLHQRVAASFSIAAMAEKMAAFYRGLIE